MAENPGEQSWSPHSGQEAETERKGPGTSYTLPGHSSYDLLPPARPHLLVSHNAIKL
jgi:hypothetical protein